MRAHSSTTGPILITLLLVLSGSPLLAEQALSSNGATRWIEQALDAVRLQSIGAPPVIGTPDAGRLYAMVAVAIYDAVNGIDRARFIGRAHAMVPPSGAPLIGHRHIAAAAAAHTVLRGLLRADKPPIADGTLDAALAAEIAAAGGARAPWVTTALTWGTHVGEQVLALRAADGTQTAQTIPACSGSSFASPGPPCEPGEFHASFDARWRSMTPFGVASLDPYRSGFPPSLTSAQYAADFNDVRVCGSNSAALDALCPDPVSASERAEMSAFWLAEAGTPRETGIWFQAALAIVAQQGTDRSISRSARLFALIGMAVADAVALAWDTKATHFTWRPTFAIRQADADGNPDTHPDPGWTSRITSAGGSPEYNSGTSAFAGAASAVIEGFYCHGTVSFSFATDAATNGARPYASPLQAAEEAGRSRIFQGIHFQFSNVDGRRAGRAIGADIVATRLRPVGYALPWDSCP